MERRRLAASTSRRQAAPAGLDTNFAGYLEAFRYGMPPHGGFGMGAERLLQMIVGAGNLRETTLFPRDMKRLSP